VHRVVFLLITSLFLRLPALQIHEYDTDQHDRYSNNPAFIASAYDLSGVALTDNGRFATLVHPNVILSAVHYPVAVGQVIPFRLGNAPDAPRVQRTVTQRFQAAGSDLFICVLDAAVTENVAVYAFATQALPSTEDWGLNYPYVGRSHLHVGRSPGSFSTELDMALGQNILDDRQIELTVGGQTGNTVECKRDLSGDPNFLQDETMAQGGDSSAPLLHIENNGSLTVVGIAWYIRPSIMDGANDITGFTAVGDYAASIQNVIQTHGQIYMPLAPENLDVQWGSGLEVELSWTDLSALETGYEIERAPSGEGPWTQLVSLAPDSESYTDTSASADKWYYRVRAVNGSSPGEWQQVTLPLSYEVWASTIAWAGADSSPTGDANGDDVTNLEAFAFVVSPLQVATQALPRIQHSATAIQLEYRKNPDADTIQYRFRSSASLTSPSWTELIVDGSVITESELGLEDGAINIQINIPLSEVGSPSFFQLQVEDVPIP